MINELARKFSLIGVLLAGTLIFNLGNHASAVSSDGTASNDVTPPTVTISASPAAIKSVKKGHLVQSAFSGVVEDLGSGLIWPTTVELIDEYGELNRVINPVFTENVPGGGWSEGWDINGRIFTGYVMVEAWTSGWDADGRTYTIRHTAYDLAGNKTVAEAKVTVLHNKTKTEDRSLPAYSR